MNLTNGSEKTTLPGKPRSKRLVIIGANLLLVSLAFMYLFNEYRRVGKFQWVDPHAFEDHEEFYFTPIFVAIFFFGAISVIYEAMKFRTAVLRTLAGRISGTILKSISNIYAAILIFVSFIFITITLGSIGKHDFEEEFILEVSLFLLILLSIGLLGGLMISNNLKEKNNG